MLRFYIIIIFFTEGPMSHDQPTYASVPGIRVYGMMCVQGNRRGRPLRHIRSLLGMEIIFFKSAHCVVIF